MRESVRRDFDSCNDQRVLIGFPVELDEDDVLMGWVRTASPFPHPFVGFREFGGYLFESQFSAVVATTAGLGARAKIGPWI